jgi:SAM-dependent methyltransferase
VRASERLAWAAGVVAPAETDRMLEVGCGHGVLVSLLAAQAHLGEVVGVDRSATMTAAAGRRNADAVADGRVRLVTAPLTGADLGTAPFDVVVAFDVRAFCTPPAPSGTSSAGCSPREGGSSSPSRGWARATTSASARPSADWQGIAA